MDAWGGGAKVVFNMTPFTTESSRALALVVVDQIHTIRVESTWRVGAVINILITRRSFPSGHTLALESSQLLSDTSCSISTWIVCRANVRDLLAVWSGESGSAQTRGRLHPW